MMNALRSLGKGARAWHAGWAVWLVVVTIWVFALPFMSQRVTPDSLGMALIAALCLMALLMPVLFWLMRIAMQPEKQWLLAPLLAFFLFLAFTFIAPWPFGEIPSSSPGEFPAAVPFLLGASFFSLSFPALALSVFLSQDDFASLWMLRGVLFISLVFVTIVPVWIASLVKHGRSDQRRLVWGLFIGYWIYVILGMLFAVWLGPSAFWG